MIKTRHRRPDLLNSPPVPNVGHLWSGQRAVDVQRQTAQGLPRQVLTSRDVLQKCLSRQVIPPLPLAR